MQSSNFQSLTEYFDPYFQKKTFSSAEFQSLNKFIMNETSS
jgi:hypothetical protein